MLFSYFKFGLVRRNKTVDCILGWRWATNLLILQIDKSATFRNNYYIMGCVDPGTINICLVAGICEKFKWRRRDWRICSGSTIRFG